MPITVALKHEIGTDVIKDRHPLCSENHQTWLRKVRDIRQWRDRHQGHGSETRDGSEAKSQTDLSVRCNPDEHRGGLANRRLGDVRAGGDPDLREARDPSLWGQFPDPHCLFLTHILGRPSSLPAQAARKRRQTSPEQQSASVLPEV